MVINMYHTKCNCEVMIDVTRCFSISGGVSIGPKSLKVVWLGINQVPNSKKEEIVFVCPQCGCGVPTADIYSFCMDCGDQTPINNMLVVGSRIYCSTCIDIRHINDNVSELSAIVQKVYIGK